MILLCEKRCGKISVARVREQDNDVLALVLGS